MSQCAQCEGTQAYLRQLEDEVKRAWKRCSEIDAERSEKLMQAQDRIWKLERAITSESTDDVA